jgi:hypothetical protein
MKLTKENIKVLKSPEWIDWHYAHDTKRNEFWANSFDGIIPMEVLDPLDNFNQPV